MELFEYIDVMNTPYQIYMEEVRSPDFYVKGHWHYFMEILYVLEGSIHVDCGKYRYTLTPDMIIALPPKMLHRIRTNGTVPVRYAVVKFDVNGIRIPGVYISGIRKTLAMVQERNPMIFEQDVQGRNGLGNLIQTCMDELRDKDFGYELNIYSGLATLLVRMVRIWEPAQTEESLMTERTQLGETFFDHIPEYIDAHAAEPLRIQELAEMSGMSYSNFAKNFKLQYGRSCKEYIEYIRISKAEELVLYSDYEISYIAQESGFADASHFIRIYKKFKDITPKQARLLIKSPKEY